MSPNNNIRKFKTARKAGNGMSVTKVIGLAVVALALIGLIFSSFAGLRGSSGQLTFGRYGSKDIVYSYSNTFGSAVQSAMDQYNTTLTGSEADNPLYDMMRRLAWNQAFSQAAQVTAMVYQLDESGYNVSSRAVDRAMLSQGRYLTNGQFDETKYKNDNAAQKKALREQLHEQLALAAWGTDVLALRRSRAELDFIDGMRADKRTYDYVVIPFDAFPEDDVLAYAKENESLFASRNLSRITAADEETALGLLEKYNAAEEVDAFASLARESSTDSYRDAGGSMGGTKLYTLYDIITTEEADEVFAMEEGGVTGPVETEYGWILFKADGPVTELIPEESLDELRSYMLQNEVGLVEDGVMAIAEAIRNQALEFDLSTAAFDRGFTVKTTPAFAVNYKNRALLGTGPASGGDQSLTNASASESFWEALIPLKEVGEISRPVVLSSAVGVFALASEVSEPAENMEQILAGYSRQSFQQDFREMILNSEDTLLKNDFEASYSRVFPSPN